MKFILFILPLLMCVMPGILCAQPYNPQYKAQLDKQKIINSNFDAKTISQNAVKNQNMASQVQIHLVSVKSVADKIGSNDITNLSVAIKHAQLHLDVLAGKVFGESQAKAVTMLGMLGSGDSALVGNQNYIPGIFSTLINTYTKGKTQQTYISSPGTQTPQVKESPFQVKRQSLISIALIANANYSMPLQYSAGTIGGYALSFLYNIVVNEKEKYSLRREAVIALAAIRQPSAVDKISRCITFINKNHIGMDDDSFLFDRDGKLYDSVEQSEDEDEALLTALMIALDAQMDGPGKDAALGKLKWYAGLGSSQLNYINYSAFKLHTDYSDKGGNTTTYLAALYLLSERGLVPSLIKQDPVNTNRYYEARRESKRIEYIVENHGVDMFKEYECYTRRAFFNSYNKHSKWAEYRQRGFITSEGQSVQEPISFDQCLKQKTDEMMFEVMKFLASWCTGALIEEKIIKVSIKEGAKVIFNYATAKKVSDTAIKAYEAYSKYSSAKSYADLMITLTKTAAK